MYDVWFPYLNIKIKYLPRVAFSFFGLDIYYYGLIISLAIFLGTYVILFEAKKTYQDQDLYIDFLFWAIIFSIIGARLYYVIFSWEDYKYNLIKILALREGGIAIYGAIIFGFILAIIFCKKKNCDIKLFLDTCSFGLLTGQIIGRWGNFFNREAFGCATNNFLAMRYLASKVNYSYYNNIKPIIINDFKYIQVHPTFLYESIWNLILLLSLFFYNNYKKFNGEIFLLYIFFYSIGRFFIEGLRVDKLILFCFPVSQLVSVILFIISGAILFKRYFLGYRIR